MEIYTVPVLVLLGIAVVVPVVLVPLIKKYSKNNKKGN